MLLGSARLAQRAAADRLRARPSGDYVIPQGLSVLRIDREADLGTYVEPNIWIRHR